MTPEQFTAVLKLATPEQLDALDQAHWRYISMMGLISDVLPDEVVEADRKAYPHFIKSRPVYNDDECKTFMVEVTGLSPEFCEAWRDQDFYTLHGESGEDMGRRQKPSFWARVRKLASGRVARFGLLYLLIGAAGTIAALKTQGGDAALCTLIILSYLFAPFCNSVHKAFLAREARGQQ
ncbi:hypothetical protein HX137_31630 [Pseudomonas sp. 165]|uniref:Uncharacterized protein n=1 Tax=Pseudomonas juntendi TaxID=2666183 RepID=A0AAJ5SBA8_9PSED|nr:MULTISPECIES: hypothetical protein [Pseudomonas]MDM1715168.1 hypothetical protein [Pseudomonas sp. 165]WEA23667.1 hypothetical protein PWA60_27080 [Pseudomonas juntendi]